MPLTVAPLLTISIPGLVVVSAPGVFDTVDRFGHAAEQASRSVTKTSG